jgi:cellulose synthase operon protein C
VVALAVPANRSAALVRPLPAGLPDGFAPGSVAALRAVAVRALGENAAGQLLTLLRSEKFLQDTIVRGTDGSAVYPYRYPPLTRLLDQAPGQGRTAAAGALGAALLLVAAQPEQDGLSPAGYERIGAAAAAFGVLERARADGDCAAQLNLLL